MHTQLSSRALLVSVNISMWTARKFDQLATQAVEDTHRVSKVGRFNKVLLEPEHLRPVTACAIAVRTAHHSRTLPWGDQGERLLAGSNFFDFQELMNRRCQQFDEAVAGLVVAYPELLRQASISLGRLFSPADYPAVGNLASRFSAVVSYSPIPQLSDLRTELSDEHQQAILRGAVADTLQLRLDGATDALLNRLRPAVHELHNRLDPEKAPTLNNTKYVRAHLVEAALAALDAALTLNVADDERVAFIAQQLGACRADICAIRGHSPWGPSHAAAYRACTRIKDYMEW